MSCGLLCFFKKAGIWRVPYLVLLYNHLLLPISLILYPLGLQILAFSRTLLLNVNGILQCFEIRSQSAKGLLLST